MPLENRKLITEARLELRTIRPDADEGRRIPEVIRNVKERKNAEAQFREKERLIEMGRMSDIFAHEIANPLQGILTTLDLIKESIPAEHFDLINDLATEASHLELLLKQFRSLSTLSDLNVSSVDLTRLVDRLVGIYSKYWSGLGIRVVTDFARSLTLEADTVRLHQVIVNLCRNAVRSMPDGGSLTFRTYANGEKAVLELSDTGPATGQDEGVFELFTTIKAQKIGIGMYVVQQIVSAHGGTVTYSNKDGTGTTFRVTLPRKTSLKVGSPDG